MTSSTMGEDERIDFFPDRRQKIPFSSSGISIWFSFASLTLEHSCVNFPPNLSLFLLLSTHSPTTLLPLHSYITFTPPTRSTILSTKLLILLDCKISNKLSETLVS